VRAIICASFGAGVVADHFRALASELTRRGHEVTLVSWHSHGAKPFGPPGIRLLTFPSPRPTRLRDIWFLRRLVRDHRANCLIANFGAVNVAALVGWISSVPVRVGWYRTLWGQIVVDHPEMVWLRSLRVLRKRWIYSLCTHIVGNSAASALELKSFWRIPDAKVRVFWNSMPDPGGRVPEADRQEGLIVCVGRLSVSKGQEVLVRALPQLRGRHESARVIFLGDGEGRERLVRLVQELGVEGAVEFRGFVSHDEVIRTMSRAAVVAVPSHEEAFGNINMEALSVGTAVVASRVGGIPELVRDGIEGLLFERGNSQQLAGCLATLLSDASLREALGVRARARFLEMFEAKAAVNAQVAWLEGLERASG